MHIMNGRSWKDLLIKKSKTKEKRAEPARELQCRLKEENHIQKLPRNDMQMLQFLDARNAGILRREVPTFFVIMEKIVWIKMAAKDGVLFRHQHGNRRVNNPLRRKPLGK